MKANEGITFQAIFQKLTTLVDGGYRISFDVSENDAKQLLQISQLRQNVLQIAIVPTDEVDYE